MSTRAVRTEIALQKLDPRLPHNKVDKQGRLVSYDAGPGPEPVAVVEAVVEEPKVKNALVQLEPEEAPKTEVSEVVEESKQDAPESEETPKKKSGKKEKKVVSTDP